MENTKKKGKGLVITLAIFMVVFATCAALLFTGVVKSPLVEEKKCTETKVDTKTTDDTKKTDTKTDTTTTKTADERYKEYITSLAASIKEKYVSDHEIHSESHESKDYYNAESYMYTNSSYGVAIKSNLELVYTSNGIRDQHIADNVVSFYNIHEGNGLDYFIYFITTDGKLHRTELIDHIFNNTELTIEDLDYKNIIEVKQGSAVAAVPIFIDIDGNVIFRNN